MQTMHAKDAISGKLGEAWLTTKDGERLLLMQLIKIEASIEKTKTEVPILGRTGKGNKSTGWSGSGSATIHYVTSRFRKMLLDFKNTGQDTYFDLQLTNEDPTSSVGRQTVVLKDCNLDGGILAKLDTEADYLDEEISFTFEDFEMPEKFTELA